MFASSFLDHSVPLAAGALLICAVTAWLLLVLIARAASEGGFCKVRWSAFAALVGGFGVWATHFIATLGFRPDIEFAFDVPRTVASALLGVALVGAPVAATAFSPGFGPALAGGALAGTGTAVMHHFGMTSLTDFRFENDAGTMLLLAAVGASFFAAALPLARRRRIVPATILVVAAVAVVHFAAIASARMISVPGGRGGIDQTTLGLLVGTVAFSLLLGALVFVVSSARFAEKERQKGLMSTALDNMSNGLLLIGANGRIELYNDRLRMLFGIAPSDVAIGMRWQRFLGNLAPRLGWSAQRLSRIVANHEAWFARAETTYVEHALEDGRTISVACRPIGSGGAVLTYDDVTAERLAQKEIERLAFQDPLTGLANRRAFQSALEATLAASARATLLLIDLDRFKSVNDTLGHAAGDRLLGEVGRRLTELCTGGEFVSRLAGDEFAILSTGKTAEATAALCDAVTASLATPFLIEGRPVAAGCSIGIAVAEGRSGSPSAIVQHADLALYKAKALGRGRGQLYEPGMQEAAARRARMEADLRLALRAGEFHLLYQPLFRLRDRRILGFEALLRWRHPQRGEIGPAEFIPVAEEAGLIHEIGAWIIAESCRQVAEWPEGVHVAVNVSPTQLRNELFPLQLAAHLNAADLKPERLQIELTETALVSDSDQIAQSLRSLREFGIRVAMDDFGTGYSSFAHLRDFDLDWIKIDRSFVQPAPKSRSAAAVLGAVLHMAKGLGVGTIAEGVETHEQLALLERAGCTAAQGFLFARPMSGEEASALCGGARVAGIGVPSGSRRSR